MTLWRAIGLLICERFPDSPEAHAFSARYRRFCLVRRQAFGGLQFLWGGVILTLTDIERNDEYEG